MMLRLFLIYLIFISLVSESDGQEMQFSTSSKKALKQYEIAETSFRQQNFLECTEALKKAIRHDKYFIEAWLLLGDAYRELGQDEDALDAFNRAISIDSTFFPPVFYFTGQLHYTAGNYASATDQFEKFLKLVPGSSPIRTKVEEAYRRASFAEYAINNPTSSPPQNAGPLVNSANDDYVNYVRIDKPEMVITRKEPLETDQYGRTIYIESFYVARLADGQWLSPDSLKIRWAEGYNLGGMNISVDGRKMYFTGCNWPGGFGSCDLYVSFKSGDDWEEPYNLGTLVNSQWWDSQPFISANGKQLYFSSKRAGGKGKTDIWMSFRLPDGKWSSPVNLGDSINTGGSEMAPFIHPDGKTLYFSSDGHDGLGGYDLFYSKKDETGRWSKATNLGYPLNSKDNEINLVVDLFGRHLMLSSDRSGGEGKVDIYHGQTHDAMKPQKVSFIKGKVLDEKTSEPVSAFVELSNLKTGLSEDSTWSDRVNGEFFMVLQPETNYAFNITADNYLIYSENYNLENTEETYPVEKVFYLTRAEAGKRITLENVYFPFNSAALMAISFVELDKLTLLMKDNLSMRLRIEGHTDNTGTDDYNLTLSEQRAQSVVYYLVEKGIDQERLEWIGYGASRPIAENNTVEGKAKNRRTEIVVLK
jgi:outer membrane protein OmpA-like peptidoglycan-associated protein